MDDLGVRNNLIGLVIGAIPTISKACCQVIDQLLDRPEALASARAAAQSGENHSDMLTHDEQVLWKLVRDNGWVWRGRYDDADKWVLRIEEQSLIYERLRERWEDFNAVARGEADKPRLPDWLRERAKPKPAPGKRNDVDDEIPF